MPKSRLDIGTPRNLDSNAISKILELKGIFPYITGTLIYHKLIEEGYVKENKTLLQCFVHFFFSS